eukprot:8093470-Heterocapsa_arctica.AAC.1
MKEAFITLVTTYRSLGSRATQLFLPPQWDRDGSTISFMTRAKHTSSTPETAHKFFHWPSAPLLDASWSSGTIGKHPGAFLEYTNQDDTITKTHIMDLDWTAAAHDHKHLAKVHYWSLATLDARSS